MLSLWLHPLFEKHMFLVAMPSHHGHNGDGNVLSKKHFLEMMKTKWVGPHPPHDNIWLQNVGSHVLDFKRSLDLSQRVSQELKQGLESLTKS